MATVSLLLLSRAQIEAVGNYIEPVVLTVHISTRGSKTLSRQKPAETSCLCLRSYWAFGWLLSMFIPVIFYLLGSLRIFALYSNVGCLLSSSNIIFGC